MLVLDLFVILKLLNYFIFRRVDIIYSYKIQIFIYIKNKFENTKTRQIKAYLE